MSQEVKVNDKLQAELSEMLLAEAKLKEAQAKVAEARKSMTEAERAELSDLLESVQSEVKKAKDELNGLASQKKADKKSIDEKYQSAEMHLKSILIAGKSKLKALGLSSGVKTSGLSTGKWKIVDNGESIELTYRANDEKKSLYSKKIKVADLQDKTKVKSLKVELMTSWGLSQKTIVSQFTNNVVAFDGDRADLRFRK